ncbi:UxaA family hydrolase [Sodalis ligni]|jgi:altronate dehydratase small subunit|uniref:SAF domain-containing protein n=1 Tax=Sodalis ligni TaxID=2697027 RepID=A0A4R1NA87_9GAMM|nr:UxaA family hydrolase [Sodalis ligni]QWA12274.1 UxaA family hydrolase [Sodalis ligni]TCL04315.1 SAF domain-containing protein [Sodalis ligni]
MSKRALLLNPKDNCVVALEDIAKGDEVNYEGGEFTALHDVTLGHKLAIVDMESGAQVYKYGAIIGSATQTIGRGSHIHSHNLKSNYIEGYHHDDAGYSASGEQA